MKCPSDTSMHRDLTERTQETLVLSKETLAKYYTVTNIEIKITCPTNKQLQYVAGCV